jgi:hypothetical protein
MHRVAAVKAPERHLRGTFEGAGEERSRTEGRLVSSQRRGAWRDRAGSRCWARGPASLVSRHPDSNRWSTLQRPKITMGRPAAAFE